MKLQDIDYTDFAHLCMKYCIDRLGANISYKDLIDIVEDKAKEFNKNIKLNPGDILVFKNHDHPHFIQTQSQISSGILIDKYVNITNHYCVYEGNGIISDAYIHNDFITIRNRLLTDMSKGPTYYIRAENILNKEKAA